MLVQIFVRNKIITLLLASLLATTAMAEEELEEMPADAPKPAPSAPVSAKPGSGGGGKGRTVYLEFGNELIDGTGVKPSVEYLFTRSQFNYKRLIRLRENFQSEVKEGRGDFSGSSR